MLRLSKISFLVIALAVYTSYGAVIPANVLARRKSEGVNTLALADSDADSTQSNPFTSTSSGGLSSTQSTVTITTTLTSPQSLDTTSTDGAAISTITVTVTSGSSSSTSTDTIPTTSESSSSTLDTTPTTSESSSSTLDTASTASGSSTSMSSLTDTTSTASGSPNSTSSDTTTAATSTASTTPSTLPAIDMKKYYALFRDGNNYLQAQGTRLVVQQHADNFDALSAGNDKSLRFRFPAGLAVHGTGIITNQADNNDMIGIYGNTWAINLDPDTTSGDDTAAVTSMDNGVTISVKGSKYIGPNAEVANTAFTWSVKEIRGAPPQDP